MIALTRDPRGFHRLTIQGEVTEQDMREGLEAFLAALPASGKADFLYTIRNFEFPSLSALAVEFGYLPRLLQALPRIGKVAVAADAAWLRGAATLEGILIPGLTIRTFTLDELEAAEDWLTGT